MKRTTDPNILSSFFSDETEQYRIPPEPDPYETVTLRFRAEKDSVKRALLYTFGQELSILMRKTESDEYFDWFSSEIVLSDREVAYCYIIETETGCFLYDKGGSKPVQFGSASHNRSGADSCTESDNSDASVPFGLVPAPDRTLAFRFTPGFHVPVWSRGAVQYQIFTDRFRNGSPKNDVRDNEYWYVDGHSKHSEEWGSLPNDADIRTFFGGDLQGVREKLDYLQDLGVEAIYFNPLFISPSSHKYDTQDYDHIDPHFAVIAEDADKPMESWEKHNGFAPGYITRTTSSANLQKSDAYFARLCKEMHRRGMKIILDGVFNHCGSFNKWMDREGIYLSRPGFAKGAYQDTNSPYRGYFRFSSRGNSRYADYEGWWGHATLPKLNYDESPELTEAIMKIAEKWASPPYSIDGWRLDVAADLGHSPEFNHRFWREFRRRVKAVNPDILIIAEHYGDPSDWLRGDQWDTVMNYDAFMDPVSWFLTGMEKHSDWRRDDLYRDGKAFFASMAEAMARFQRPSLDSAMNELSNHDHSRFLTRTNRRTGRLADAGSAAAGEGVNRGVFMQAVVMQMTWPGAPTIYYGDEAGTVGWTDPDNRRTYPWGSEDTVLIDLHRFLTRFRREFPELRTGSFKPLHAEYGSVAYARFGKSRAVFTVVNNSDTEKRITLRARDAGIPDGAHIFRRLMTYDGGFLPAEISIGTVVSGDITIDLPAGTSAIYTAGK